MYPRRNPYAPGAGTPPPELAGRNDLIERAAIALDRIRAGRSARGVILYGLRGVGKTVLLNRIRLDAEARGRICLTNNAAERALRTLALGRKAWLFAGSDRGGQRAAMMYSLITTAKINGIDPHAWLADVLARIANHPAHRLDELMPWNWTPPAQTIQIDQQAA
jgi:hypothetical protein